MGRPPSAPVKHSLGKGEVDGSNPGWQHRLLRIAFTRRSGVLTIAHARSRDAFCARALLDNRPLRNRGRREGREPAAPMARLQKEMQAAGTTGSAGTSRPSLRNGLTTYTRSPWGPGFLAPITRDAPSTPAGLASASGDQDHATSPSVMSQVVSR
jgi:hypothetical protein